MKIEEAFRIAAAESGVPPEQLQRVLDKIRITIPSPQNRLDTNIPPGNERAMVEVFKQHLAMAKRNPGAATQFFTNIVKATSKNN